VSALKTYIFVRVMFSHKINVRLQPEFESNIEIAAGFTEQLLAKIDNQV
jgi:hypothetical protein